MNAIIKRQAKTMNIHPRSSVSVTEILSESPEELIDEHGLLKDETLKAFKRLVVGLYHEACLAEYLFRHDKVCKYISPESDDVLKHMFWNRVHLIRLAYSRMIEVVDYSSSHYQNKQTSTLKAELSATLTRMNNFYSKFQDESEAFRLSLIHFKKQSKAHNELTAHFRVSVCQSPMRKELGNGEPYVLEYIQRVNDLLENGSQ